MYYYELKKSTKDGAQPYYFVLKAANHEVIAKSEMYASKQSALKGIASVQKNGSSETIKDLTE
ncbi:YegP family protein [Providencia hangzhouensis]|uniref:YegP family protein n=1 Tax=Providencia hangzhouensis TaxID=3031799 RepID=UPI0034DD0B48